MIASPHPLSKLYREEEDLVLIQKALQGSKEALEVLCSRHQAFIYNLSLKMVNEPHDAKDITQEVLIKMITKLSQFKGHSHFRTWLYRMVVNHFLDMKKTNKEKNVTGFTFYRNFLDNTPNQDLSTDEEKEYEEVIQEVRIGCSAGMLLCLNREQRLVYILSDIFEIDHNLGSAIMNTSKENFRQKATRARKDLHNFMNNQCGLVNKANPCRCPKKTKSFIKMGLVDPQKRIFNANFKKRIYQQLQKEKIVCDSIDEAYIQIFQNHPYQTEDLPHIKSEINKLLENKTLFLE